MGVEKKPLPHLLCLTNMILHGIETPDNIKRDNSLSRPPRDYAPSEKVDIVLTNPPFGGIEEAGIRNNFPSKFQTSETADLFMYMIYRRLREGGRAGVVLPDSFLSGDGVKGRLKELMISKCNLHTVVRLPAGVFAPYSGVRTSLIFFNKGEQTKDIWFYELPLPDGMNQYTKGTPIAHQEFEPVKEWWDDRKQNDNAWKVPAQKVIDKNYDLHIPNPSKLNNHEIVDKDELLVQASELSGEIKDIVDKLNQAFSS